jgi:hypothetical protein
MEIIMSKNSHLFASYSEERVFVHNHTNANVFEILKEIILQGRVNWKIKESFLKEVVSELESETSKCSNQGYGTMTRYRKECVQKGVCTASGYPGRRPYGGEEGGMPWELHMPLELDPDPERTGE